MPKQKNPKAAKLRKTSPKKSRTSIKPKNTNRKLALFFILLGVVLTITPLLFYFNQTIQLSFFTPRTNAVVQKSTNASPVEVSIPAVDLQLPIKNTKITNGAWEIAQKGASYLETSAKPGQKGAIILYGHNTEEVFGSILDLTPDKKILIRTADGKNRIYTITKTLEVYPTQMEVFEQKEEILILYTCSGFADLKRFIIIAKPTL